MAMKTMTTTKNTDFLFQLAEKARGESLFILARRHYLRILKNNSTELLDKAAAWKGLADVERIQGYFQEALGHYRQARMIFQNRDLDSALDAQVGGALAARAVGRPRQALRDLRDALSKYQKQKDKEGEAFTHWALGGTLRISGDMKEGLQELQKALKMFKARGNSEGVSYVCCALGGIFRMLGRYGESGKYYREANRRMRQRGDTFGTAYSYCGLGNVERMAGRFRKALPFYRKAEKLYATIGDRVSYAYTLWSIGTTYKMMKSYAQSLSAFRTADDLFKKTGDTRGRIYTLLGFAEVEWMRDRKSKGRFYWKQAKAIVEKSDFLWEKLHVEALKDGQARPLAERYQKAGSLFHPIHFPVNWP